MNPVVTGNYCWRHKHQDPNYDPANPSTPDTTAPTTSRSGANTANAPHARRERWSRENWLKTFEETLLVTAACKATGVGRTTVYEERQRNEEFALAWADIEEGLKERLHAEAVRRAAEGVERLVVSAGREIGTEQHFSDQLLMFLLKAKDPETYRENVKITHGGSINRTLNVDLGKLSDAEVEQLEHIARALEAA